MHQALTVAEQHALPMTVQRTHRMAEIISQLMVAVDCAAKLDLCQIGLAVEIHYFIDRALVVRDDEIIVVVFVNCGDGCFRRLLVLAVRLM